MSESGQQQFFGFGCLIGLLRLLQESAAVDKCCLFGRNWWSINSTQPRLIKIEFVLLQRVLGFGPSGVAFFAVVQRGILITIVSGPFGGVEQGEYPFPQALQNEVLLAPARPPKLLIHLEKLVHDFIIEIN